MNNNNNNDGILCVERMVLESLSRKGASVCELAEDTMLNFNVVSNILFELKLKNMVVFNGSQYLINTCKQKEWISKINEKNHVKEEVKELFSSLVNQYFMDEQTLTSPNLKMKKVWMTEKEDKIFQILLGNLKTFLDQVGEDRKKDQRIQAMAKQRVIFWGHSQYSDLVNGILEAI